jgi:DNA repair protein RecN (Recombination protein N)
MEARRKLRALAKAQADIGGDARSRTRELDLLRYQVGELDAAGIDSPSEDDDLRGEEEWLSDASTLRQAAAMVAEGLAGDEGIIDRLGSLVSELSGRPPLRSLHDRLLAGQAELSDVAGGARAAVETFEDDPGRLTEVGARRRLLTDLRRKYGDTLAEVIAFGNQARARIAELEDHDSRAASLDRDRSEAEAELRAAEERLGTARRASAAAFAAEVESALRELAMPRARFGVEIGSDLAGEEVTWLLGANPGESLLPLAKVASGGELARAMLAVRLVLTRRRAERAERGGRVAVAALGGPGGAGGAGDTDEVRRLDVAPTLVFDEVDAGIGGEAAVAVGRALADLGAEHQVLVVTHLPQVAAFADRHLVVHKHAIGERTVASAETVDGSARVVELSRMLSGRPDSATARRHAEELLAHRQPGSPM